jgi:GTP-binding protein
MTLDSSFKVATMEGRKNLKAKNSLFSSQVDFVKGVVSLDGFPPDDRPEVCFAGRSNVGKSSLLNAITKRKSLARTSNTPGRTQQINYFSVSNKLYIVDLPGYGYAKAPLNEVQKWQELVFSYMSGRRNLKRIFLLIDIRHGIKSNDIEIMNLLDEAAVNYQIIFTKCDKIKGQTLENLVMDYAKSLDSQIAVYPEVIISSAQQKEGIEIIRSEIEKFC